MKTTTEEWRPIEGFPKYEVSNLGKVRSLNYKRSGKVGILKTGLNKMGYPQVNLYNESGVRLFLVHRLVIETFTPNPDKKRTVNHRNGLKDDNRIQNLEWASYQENTVHAFKTGLNAGPPKKAVDVYDYKSGEYVSTEESINAAARKYGLNDANIGKVLKGKYNYLGGFVFRYAQ